MARRRIRLLGTLDLGVPASGRTRVPRKAAALLAYLAMQPGVVHSRDRLAALLWGGSTDERARHSLRQALLELRRAFPRPPLLRETSETVASDPDALDVDVLAFERLAAERTPAALERALGLYRGDLLQGFDVAEPAFEEWLRSERERLRELALQALARLMAHQAEIGQRARAIQTAGRLLALDPIQESAHRALMRLYVQEGRWGAALRQYEACLDILQRELGVEPEAETRRLYQEILRRRDVAAPAPEPPALAAREPPGHESALIGRERERQELRGALKNASGGRGGVILITGEAGIGKTRLVEEFAAEAAAGGSRVLAGRAYESEQSLPLAPWIDALRLGGMVADDALRDLEPVWRAELGRLLPELATPGLPRPSEDPLRLFQAVGRLIRQLAGRQPLVLLLEDLHWADEMTNRLVAFVGRRLAPCPALLVVTAREEELADARSLQAAVDELERERHVVRLALGPLSRADTSALVRALGGKGRTAAALAGLDDRVWAASEGHPFIVVETLRELDPGPAPLTPGGLPLPERVRKLVLGRVERLGETARGLAAVAAAIGRQFEFALLARAAGLAEPEAAEALEELVRRRVVRERSDRFEFTHDWIREVVYESLLTPRRMLLHRQVLEALEQRPAQRADESLDLLAHQALRAEAWAKAVTYLRQAGTTAFARSAYEQAVAYFERALEALGRLPATRERLAQAVDLCFDARTALVALGALARTLDRLREAERLVHRLDDPRRLGWVSVYLAHYFLMVAELSQARGYADRARAIAERVEDFSLRVAATHYAGWARLGTGDYPGAEECFRAVVGWLGEGRETERCRLTGFPAVMARWLLAELLGERGEFDEALTQAEEAVRIAERLDHPFSLVLACWALGSAHQRRGRLGEATRPFERGLDIAREWNIQLLAPHVTARLGLTYARAGRVAEGGAMIEHALGTIEASAMRVFHAAYVVHHGEACLLAGRHAEALTAADRALRLARERRERGCEAWALHLSGEVHARSAPPGIEAAEHHYREALALARGLGMEPLAARCRLGLGRLYAALGRGAEARSELVAAGEAFRRMGMVSWAATAERAHETCSPS